MKKVIITVAVISLLGFGAYKIYKQINKLKDTCVSLKSYKVTKLGLSRVDMLLSLSLKNISAITIELNSYDLSVYVNNMFVSRSKSDKAQTISANAESIVDLNISFEPKQVLKTAFSLENLKNLDLSSLDISKFDNVKISVRGFVNAKVGKVVSLSKQKVDYDVLLKDLKGGDNKSKC